MGLAIIRANQNFSDKSHESLHSMSGSTNREMSPSEPVDPESPLDPTYGLKSTITMTKEDLLVQVSLKQQPVPRFFRWTTDKQASIDHTRNGKTTRANILITWNFPGCCLYRCR